MTVRKAMAGFVAGLLVGAVAPAMSHGNRTNRAVVKVDGGYSTCAEDERLVPVRHHGYNAEREGGWVYKCQNFEVRGDFAK